MHAPNKILVPVDLSDQATRGLDYAAMLARSFDATLVVACNINAPERADLELVAAEEEASTVEAGHLVLARLAAAHAPDVAVEIVISEHESPAHGILAVAADADVDMIVIASHGRTGMSRWLLGSVAEKLARSADVPVAIVPGHWDGVG